MNPIIYGSSTQSVCTVSVSTVTMVSAGICTITADQAGDTNYAAATQVTRNVTINPALPTAPTIGTATAGNTVATINFTPPVNNTGSPITSYNATCAPSGSGSNSVSPINLTGLTNNVTYTCSVTATNAAGTGPASGSVMVTPVSVVPPGAPTIGAATPGDTQATIAFTPPVSDGGGAISNYTATCNPGNLTGSNSASPIVVPSLVNGIAYSCSVTATNAAGTGDASATVNVTPLPVLALAAVVSRKTHGAAGDFGFGINAATLIGGLVDVEPRTIGSGHTIVFSFNNAITAAGSVAVVDALGAAVGAATSTSAGNDVVVTLTSIADNKRVTVTLTNVNGVVTPFSASLGFLVGDVNNTRSVNSSDISSVKARSGQATTALNFKFDVNATGAVNSSDISAVKARSGLTLSP